MGNNLYADLLPYKDWVMLNNAQRMHEAGYEYTFVLLPNLFITALSYPRLAAYISVFYAFARLNHINAYTSFRGYNNAMLHEELMRLSLILVLGGAFSSAIRLSRILVPLQNRLRPASTKIKSLVLRKNANKV